MTEQWELDAKTPTEYNSVEAKRGREFILRLTTGADVVLAIQQFAKDHNIRFAKIHGMFMGGIQPCKLLMWTPDTSDPTNWHNETETTIHNLSMLLSMSGQVSVRPKGNSEEPFAAIHFVTGGAWDVPSMGGHLLEGSLVKGVCEFYITEILGIDVLWPSDHDPHASEYPENWYQKV